MNLWPFANDFLNKFSKYIEKDNRLKILWRIISHLVWFWNSNRSEYLEMQRPISKVNIYISDVDKIKNTLVISHQNLKMAPRNMIRPRSRWTTVFFIKLLNFTLKNFGHLERCFIGILSSRHKFIYQFWAELNVL